MSATMKTIKVKLPCQMDSDEYAKISKEMVQWMTDIERRKNRVEQVKEENKDPIKQAEKKVEDLRLTLNHQTIAREVECIQIYNWDTCNTHLVRLDTKEIVPGSVRKMTDGELQRDATQKPCPGKYLKLTGPVEPAEAKGETDLGEVPEAEVIDPHLKSATVEEVAVVNDNELADCAPDSDFEADFETLFDEDQPEEDDGDQEELAFDDDVTEEPDLSSFNGE